MARFAPLWQQANNYPASMDRALLNALWPSGAAMGGPPVAVAATMNISIPAGSAAVALQAGQGSALCRWDAAETVALDAATHPAGQSRIDLVVCQVRDNAIDGGANNDFVFQKITGTPAASNPVTPATPANAYLMCTVLVPGAVANLTTATVVDRRAPLRGRDLLHAYVYRAAAFNVAASAFPWDTVLFDPSGMWSAATPGRITLPAPGIYEVAARIGVTGTAANQWLAANVQQNGVTVLQGMQGVFNGSVVWPQSLAFGTVKAVAGDFLSLLPGGTAGLAVALGQAATYMSVSYLGSG